MKKPPYRGVVSRPDGIYVTTLADGVRSVYSSAPTLIETGVYESVKTPNFKLIKPRLRPNNPFNASNYLELISPGEKENGTVRWDGYLKNQHSGVYEPLPVVNSFELTDGPARSRLLKKLGNSSVNLAQSFAERKQTTNLLAKSVNRIASAAIAIRRGNLRHASNLFGLKYGSKTLQKEIKPSAKNLSNYWLEYSYGWRPLLSDIYGSAELLAKTYYENRSTLVTGSHKETQVFKEHTLFNLDQWNLRETLSGVNNERTTYKLEFVEDNAFAQRLASTGITNPLLLAWELIPYSFVLDWFIPVGTYLANLNATAGLAFRRGTVTRAQLFAGNSTWLPFAQAADPAFVMSGCGRSFLIQSKKRSVLTDFPSPLLQIKPHIGVSQAISGLALLTQAFKR